MKSTLAIIIIVIGLAVAGYFLMHQKAQFSLDTSPMTTPTATPSTSGPQWETLTKEQYTAVFKTTRGDITLVLYADKAPNAVANFVTLANKKFYDGTKFHRVIADFVIQGGDPLSRTDDPRVGTGGPGYMFADEKNGLPVDAGVIAMANSGPDTNGSQFFIVTTKHQAHLDGLHTVFGKVTAGMDVVLKIQQGDVINSIVIQ